MLKKGMALLFPLLLVSGVLTAQNPHLSEPPSKDSLLRVAAKEQDDSVKVNALHMLAALATDNNVAAAIGYGTKGMNVAKKIGYTRGVASCYMSMAYCFGISGKLRSALTYNDSAIAWYKTLDKPAAIGVCYTNRADYNMQLGKLNQALDDCNHALFYAEKTGKPGVRANVYKTFGNIYFQQKSYDQSMLYYEKSYALFQQINDTIPQTYLLNKMARIYEQKGNYLKSLEYVNKALAISELIKYDFHYSSFYTTLSNVWLKKGDKKKAKVYALKAVEYAQKNNHDKIQLADAQMALSNVYLQSDSTKLAIKAASEGFDAAVNAGVTDAQSISAAALAEGYFRSGDYKKAYEYLQVSKLLGDSIAGARYNNELAALQTSFKLNEKDKEIRLLAKDKEIQEQRLTEQNIYIVAAIVLAVLAFGGIWLAVNRNSLKQKMKELELRNRIAADLHDEVGSSLSSIHMLSQMASQSNRGNSDILDRMSNNAKETMDKMSDIVWMIKPGETEAGSLRQRMERFAYEISSSKNIDSNIELGTLENVKLSMNQRKNIYLVFKEALNNSAKYSGTEKIEVQATVRDGQLNLLIRDHGKGFITSPDEKGNGLQNMKNRAKEMNGKIEIGSIPGEGTTVMLAIPV